MAATPLPREPLSGTCDASGNATLKYRAPAHFYAHAYVAIAVSAGNPSYVITLGGSAGALIYGQGNQTQLGPVVLQPGELVQIIVTGALPGATVAGQALGWQATDPIELLPLLPIQPTAVTLLQPSLSGWSYTSSGAQPSTTTINVPAGAAGFILLPSGVGAGGTVKVTGGQTGIVYALVTVGGGSNAVPIPSLLAGDTALTIVTTLAGGSIAWQIDFTTVALPAWVTASPTYFAGVSLLAKAFTAGQEFQMIALYHPATVLESIRIRKVTFTLESSAATIISARLSRFDGVTPPSGGTAIAIAQANTLDPAPSVNNVFQTLPTTPGSLAAGIAAALHYNAGAVAATTDLTKAQVIVLYDNNDSNVRKPLIIRAGVAEGWALLLKSSAAATLTLTGAAEFTIG